MAHSFSCLQAHMMDSDERCFRSWMGGQNWSELVGRIRCFILHIQMNGRMLSSWCRMITKTKARSSTSMEAEAMDHREKKTKSNNMVC